MLDNRSRELRRTVLDVLKVSRRGHLGSAFSLIEILRVLYDTVLRYDPRRPQWPERDRFILSKGHGCLARYGILADKGFFEAGELSGFCRQGTIFGGHPNSCKIPGVEFSTGSLGHGLSVGLGMALAARADGRPSRVFVVLGDGECNEGSVWEAAMSASKHGLDNLVAIVDYNKLQSYGPTAEVMELEPFADKWRSFGFATKEADGHDLDQLRNIFSGVPLQPGRPSAVICHTVKGKGIAFVENNLEWHHKSSLSDDVIASLYEALDDNYA